MATPGKHWSSDPVAELLGARGGDTPPPPLLKTRSVLTLNSHAYGKDREKEKTEQATESLKGIFEHDFFALFPEIFPINATITLPIYGVPFSTFKQYDYLLLVCNAGWPGLPSVMRLGGHVLECEG